MMSLDMGALVPCTRPLSIQQHVCEYNRFLIDQVHFRADDSATEGYLDLRQSAGTQGMDLDMGGEMASHRFHTPRVKAEKTVSAR